MPSHARFSAMVEFDFFVLLCVYIALRHSRHQVEGANTKGLREPKALKQLTMHDFQFYDRERLDEIYAQESDLLRQKRDQILIIREMRLKESQEQVSFKQQKKKQKKEKTEADLLEEQLDQFELDEDVQNEKAALISDAFSDWTRKDYRIFVASCEKYGRKAKVQINQDVAGQTMKDQSVVAEYYKVFWERYEELSDYEKVIEKIEKGEKKIERNLNIADRIAWKV
jgi:SWI/SNF-related matrix-associated actin-dependent regulator of chromatin subfamily A member 5